MMLLMNWSEQSFIDTTQGTLWMDIRAVSWENLLIAYAKIKAQISCAVTMQLTSAFVFAT